ncbi:Lrp/AsnC family transcriptional regulator [Candidatus Woesearchaeota archaeon]|nr:Lrp/AsnC family transcriptional regulator [Candidatus Woesearchaeota archaeon]
MSEIKRELIYLYSEDARIKIKEIASMLKKSSQRVKYSLKVLEKDNIVHNPFSVFDYSYFGLLLFRVYFKGAYISERQKNEIIKELRNNSYVVAVYELGGEFDLVIEIQSPNALRFNKVLKKLSDDIPTLTHYKISLNVVTYLYPRACLVDDEYVKSKVPEQIIVGGDRAVEKFSKNELQIMQNLLDNPKIRIMTLAKAVGRNVKTVSTVLDTLKQKKIIKGSKHLVDTNKLGLHKFRLFIKLRNLSTERENQLREYLLKTKEIVLANRTVGDWDIEIDLESISKTRIRQLTLEIRENFKDVIESFNIMEFFQYYKRAYLPKYYFEQDHKIG